MMSGAACTVVAAQDTRTVTEPVIPPVCVRLEAKLLGGAGGRIVDGSGKDTENQLDTDRIQRALDGCGAGKAVELTDHVSLLRGMAGNAYLTGPLEMREGVTLLIDKGIALYGSRDPKVYEIAREDAKPGEPILCGTSMPRPASFPTFVTGAGWPKGGCRSLISITTVKNAGIMGDGVIDGRGYARPLGRDYSWWEMARKAEPKDDL